MDQGLIPRRYAKALYAVGEERSDTATLYKVMQALTNAFVSTPGLADTIANPYVSDADKTALLSKAVYGADEKPDRTSTARKMRSTALTSVLRLLWPSPSANACKLLSASI